MFDVSSFWDINDLLVYFNINKFSTPSITRLLQPISPDEHPILKKILMLYYIGAGLEYLTGAELIIQQKNSDVFQDKYKSQQDAALCCIYCRDMKMSRVYKTS